MERKLVNPIGRLLVDREVGVYPETVINFYKMYVLKQGEYEKITKVSASDDLVA